MIAGIDTGTTTITATVDGIAGSITETVGGATIANLSVVLDKSTIPVGNTRRQRPSRPMHPEMCSPDGR